VGHCIGGLFGGQSQRANDLLEQGRELLAPAVRALSPRASNPPTWRKQEPSWSNSARVA